MNTKIVVYKDGSWNIVKDGITWEYEADEDYLVTISMAQIESEIIRPIGEISQFKGTLEQLDNLTITPH